MALGWFQNVAFGLLQILIFLSITGTIAHGSSTGLLEVDMVFPRNETYAPTDLLPVVFAIQNSDLTPLISPTISVSIRNLDNFSEPLVYFTYDYTPWLNYSEHDPHFEYWGLGAFGREGHWWLIWEVTYSSCREDRMLKNGTGYDVIFTTKTGAPKADLSILKADRTCDQHNGAVVNITQTMPVPFGSEWDGGETCAAVAPATPTPNACQVDVGPDTAASISSSIESVRCKMTATPSECGEADEKKGAAKRLSIESTRSATVAVGTTIGFLIWWLNNNTY